MRRRKYVVVLLFAFTFYNSIAQTDSVGSGGAIRFDGVDDLIDFGDIYSDLELPFTISAWVNLDPSNSIIAPIFSNRNCDPIYTGFRLMVNHDVISLDYGDGFGGNNPAFRRGKNATVSSPISGSWNHITAIVKGVWDIELYLNGVNVGGEYSGSSNYLMDSSKPGFASSAYFISNGVVYRLKGLLDDIRLWDRALTENEIRNTMCFNLKGDESGLIGYWNFNEKSGTTTFDLSPNGFHGTFIDTPTRVRSGAPIGDVSTHFYSSSWAGKTVSFTNEGYALKVTDVSNSSIGVHIYSVNDPPSQTDGLGSHGTIKPYFGVFTAVQNSTSKFSVQLDLLEENSCEVFTRNDNSSFTWSNASVPIIAKQQRVELIWTNGKAVTFDLGDDVSLCNADSYQISTEITDPEYEFLWSNNESTSSITVTESGKYFVTVSGPCNTVKDSVNIAFVSEPPPSFSLGSDITSCDFTPLTLSLPDCDQCIIKWQDGSSESNFLATIFGHYWAMMENACGQSTDSVEFSTLAKEDTPTLELGADVSICNVDSYQLATQIEDPGYEILWSNNQKTSSIIVTESGKYFVSAKGLCDNLEDSITIRFLSKPPLFSLGSDTATCDFKPLTLNVPECDQCTVKWQDGSAETHYVATEFGKYWAVLENVCGQASDSIEFKKAYLDIVIPNVITPNNDGKNDSFLLAPESNAPVSLRVYDRWGIEVYHSEAYQSDWRADNLSEGVYFVVVSGPCIETEKNPVHIIR
jgi:hypothetical protein